MGFALTLEAARSSPALNPWTRAAATVMRATCPTRARAACVAAYRSGGEDGVEARLSAATVGFCSFTSTLADA